MCKFIRIIYLYFVYIIYTYLFHSREFLNTILFIFVAFLRCLLVPRDFCTSQCYFLCFVIFVKSAGELDFWSIWSVYFLKK